MTTQLSARVESVPLEAELPGLVATIATHWGALYLAAPQVALHLLRDLPTMSISTNPPAQAAR